jgi:transposase InsO family protein
MILKIIFKIIFYLQTCTIGYLSETTGIREEVENVCFPRAHCPSQRSCKPLTRGSRASESTATFRARLTSGYAPRPLLDDAGAPVLKRDTKFTQAFDGLLKPNGVKPVVLPPRNPNLHAHCERFVRSLKAESLDQMLMPDERSLSYVLQQYLVHYHAERNHRGLDKQIIALDADLRSHSSQARRRGRLGGLLCYYYRAVA